MKNTDYSFPRESRLLRKKDFDRLFQSAKKHSRSGVCVRLARTDTGCSRLGIMVSKRAGNAVVRNRIRRVIREVFRTTRPAFDADYDILVTFYKDMRSVDKNSLAVVFSDLLQEILTHRIAR